MLICTLFVRLYVCSRSFFCSIIATKDEYKKALYIAYSFSAQLTTVIH